MIERRYGEFVAQRSKTVILVVLLLTAGITAGMTRGNNESGQLGNFEVDAPETRAANYIEANYTQDQTTVAQLVVRQRDGNVLTRESLLKGLRLQKQIRTDEQLNTTVQQIVGIENIVATVAVMRDRQAAGKQPPKGLAPLEEQIAALESRSQKELTQLLEQILAPDRSLPGIQEDPYSFLPNTYDPGSTSATARLTLIVQEDKSGPSSDPQQAYDAQLTIEQLAQQQFQDSFVFGQGIRDDASTRAVGDGFAIITPVALVLVLFVLIVSYRDLLDILLAFVGIAVVMAWLTGLMGWLQVTMSQLLIAVPFLLIGLSIDYALHVVMRYREARNGSLDATVDRSLEGDQNQRGVRAGMAAGLAGVVLALGAATFSTAVGFLSNVVSPLPAIQDFALLSAGGIVGTFVVFAGLLPALKVELDGLIENRAGWSRQKQAFGVGSGLTNRALSGVASLIAGAPLALILIAALLSAGGVAGATTIDTEFNQADFLPREPPAWTSYLPGSLEPGTYTIADDFAYLSQNFGLRGGSQAEILIRGDVTDKSVLPAITTAARSVPEESSITRGPDGTAEITGPQTLIRELAGRNETVRKALTTRDTDDDGVPETEIGPFYDLLFATDETRTSAVLHRAANGTVTAVRLSVNVDGKASAQDVRTDTHTLADEIEANAPVSAVPTGGPVTRAVVQNALLETLIKAFAVTLVIILCFLLVLFWRQYGEAVLGLIVLLPVLVALCWLLGTMALLGIPFNSETAIITSLAIGLGVDYSIHAGERFVDEREQRDSLPEALEATLTGTGGALLASASTTASGFGVLALSLSPPLRRFGLVTGLSIIFAFVSCLVVLPALLVVSERLRDRIDR